MPDFTRLLYRLLINRASLFNSGNNCGSSYHLLCSNSSSFGNMGAKTLLVLFILIMESLVTNLHFSIKNMLVITFFLDRLLEW